MGGWSWWPVVLDEDACSGCGGRESRGVPGQGVLHNNSRSGCSIGSNILFLPRKLPRQCFP